MSARLLTKPLVDAAWLIPRIGESHLRILDCSLYLPAMGRDAKAEFGASRIPGATFFDIDAASDPDAAFPHTLSSASHFEAYMAGLGLNNDDDIVVYDGAGLFSAARAWWMLRHFGHQSVAVLDGGMPQYLRAGGKVDTSPGDADTALGGGTFVASDSNGFGVCDLQAVRNNALADASTRRPVMDARSSGRFLGTASEPRAGLPSGAVPHSLSVPFDSLLHPEHRTFLPSDQLRATFTAAGYDPTSEMGAQAPIFTCGSGLTACIVGLGAQLAFEDAPPPTVYDGSWTEYSTAVMLPATEQLQTQLEALLSDSSSIADIQEAGVAELQKAVTLLGEVKASQASGHVLAALGTSKDGHDLRDRCRTVAMEIQGPDFDEAKWRATFGLA